MATNDKNSPNLEKDETGVPRPKGSPTLKWEADSRRFWDRITDTWRRLVGR